MNQLAVLAFDPSGSELVICKNKVFSMLRPYQSNMVKASLHQLLKCNDTLLQSPTGSGKSIMMVAIALDALVRGESVGLIIHKEELLRQWVRTFKKFLPAGFPIGIIGDKSRYGKLRNDQAQLQIATVKTLYQAKIKPRLDLLVLDEAHHAPANEWAGVIHYYRRHNGSVIFGVTATPKRLDGKPLDELEYKNKEKAKATIPGFSQLIPGPQVLELMNEGYLVPVEVLASKYATDTDKWSIKMGDYDQKLSASEMAKINPEDVFREWLTNMGPDKLTVAYPASVGYSRNLDWYFNQQLPGISAHIDADTPAKLREQILADFAEGKIKVLFQHSIVIEGVDIPLVECVLCLRPTTSIAVWLQILGRGLRPAPGKDKLILLDFTDNHQKLPMPQDEIIWDLRDPEVIDNIQNCPECKKPRRFEQLELSDHGFFSKILKRCTKCGLEKWSTRQHMDPSRNREKDNDGEDTYNQLSIGAIFKPVLPPKDFDFSAKPVLSRFVKANPKPADYHEYISALHRFQRQRNSKPFWGIFEAIRQWYSINDNEPEDDVMYLLHDAFLAPKETISLPNRDHPGMREKIDLARRKWNWALSELTSKGEIVSH